MSKNEDTATQTLAQARPDSEQAKRDRLPAVLEEYAKDIERYGGTDSGLAPALRRAARCLTEQTEQAPRQNTDVEIWREKPDDYYSPSIHVTQDGGIGISVGGYVIVRPVRDWHRLAMNGVTRYVSGEVKQSSLDFHTQALAIVKRHTAKADVDAALVDDIARELEMASVRNIISAGWRCPDDPNHRLRSVTRTLSCGDGESMAYCVDCDEERRASWVEQPAESAKPDDDMTATAIERRARRARELVVALCHGERTWTMSIPAQPNDPDVILDAALRDLDYLVYIVRHEDAPVIEPAPSSAERCAEVISKAYGFPWTCRGGSVICGGFDIPLPFAQIIAAYYLEHGLVREGEAK